MPGFGFRYGFAGSYGTGPVGPQPVPPPLALARPSSDWTGVAGSGFASPPADPVRTTAKPAIRIITLDRQYFGTSLRVDVMAFANDGGTLINGIDRVRFYFENDDPVDVVEQRLQTFSRFDGSQYRLPVYSAELVRPSTRSGEATLMIEAVPADATMQSRVIEHTFFPHEPFDTGSIHDVELTVDPEAAELEGVNYHDWTDAHRWLAAQSPLPVNPRITVKNAAPAGKYEIKTVSGERYAPQGWLTVEADVPIMFGRLGDFVSTAEAENGSRPRLDGVWMKGANITIDAANMHIYTSFAVGDRGWVFDRVRISNEPGITQAWEGTARVRNLARGINYYVDCHITDIPNVFAPIGVDNRHGSFARAISSRAAGSTSAVITWSMSPTLSATIPISNGSRRSPRARFSIQAAVRKRRWNSPERTWETAP